MNTLKMASESKNESMGIGLCFVRIPKLFSNQQYLTQVKKHPTNAT